MSPRSSAKWLRVPALTHTNGSAVLDRDRRDERLRSVAAGHAEAVGAARDGVARELLEIEPVVEHHRLDAELAGEVDETELLDLAAAGPRVAEQDRHGAADRPRVRATSRWWRSRSIAARARTRA